MSSNILKIVLHIGTLIRTVKDVEHAIADAVKGDFKKEDVSAIISDILQLVQDGIITIPGMSSEDIEKALHDLIEAI